MLFPEPDEALALGAASLAEGDAVTEGAAETAEEAVAVAETPSVVGEGPAQSVAKLASDQSDETEATALEYASSAPSSLPDALAAGAAVTVAEARAS